MPSHRSAIRFNGRVYPVEIQPPADAPDVDASTADAQHGQGPATPSRPDPGEDDGSRSASTRRRRGPASAGDAAADSADENEQKP